MTSVVELKLQRAKWPERFDRVARRPSFAGSNESRTSNPKHRAEQEGGPAGGTWVPSALFPYGGTPPEE